MSLVTVTTPADAVAVVTLDDPSRYNALSSAMVAEIRSALAAIRADREVRVVVLTGAGRGFCAGANMGGDDDHPAAKPRAGARSGSSTCCQENLAELMLAIHELPAARHRRGARRRGRRRPRVCALACDLRIASTDAYFASHFIRVGLSSCDVGHQLLAAPRSSAPLIAAELMLTGRRVPRRGGAAIGLLNRVVEPDELLGSALELAAGITANSEYGVIMTKLGHVGQPRRAEPPRTPWSWRTAPRCSAPSPAT